MPAKNNKKQNFEEFTRATTIIRNYLELATDEERVKVFEHLEADYCRICGCPITDTITGNCFCEDE